MKVYSDGFDLLSIVKNEARVSAQAGNFYSITTGVQSITTLTPFFVVQITNPSSSSKTINIQSVFGGSFARAAGTAITPRNTNFNFSDNSVATAKFLIANADPTTDGNILYTIITGTGTTLIDFSQRIIVTGNQTFYIRVQNTSAATLSASISIDWAE